MSHPTPRTITPRSTIPAPDAMPESTPETDITPHDVFLAERGYDAALLDLARRVLFMFAEQPDTALQVVGSLTPLAYNAHLALERLDELVPHDFLRVERERVRRAARRLREVEESGVTALDGLDAPPRIG